MQLDRSERCLPRSKMRDVSNPTSSLRTSRPLWQSSRCCVRKFRRWRGRKAALQTAALRPQLVPKRGRPKRLRPHPGVKSLVLERVPRRLIFRRGHSRRSHDIGRRWHGRERTDRTIRGHGNLRGGGLQEVGQCPTKEEAEQIQYSGLAVVAMPEARPSRID